LGGGGGGYDAADKEHHQGQRNQSTQNKLSVADIKHKFLRHKAPPLKNKSSELGFFRSPKAALSGQKAALFDSGFCDSGVRKLRFRDKKLRFLTPFLMAQAVLIHDT
jgi:hypothetical protein